MDLAEGIILSQYYKSLKDQHLSEQEAIKIFCQIVEAIGYLHKNGIFHRDLKTENVMIDNQKRIKIIDFGFSVKSDPMQRLGLFCGTPNYMSPEIILKKDYYGGPSDVWALGVMLFVICAGYFPFKGRLSLSRQKRQGTSQEDLGRGAGLPTALQPAAAVTDHLDHAVQLA